MGADIEDIALLEDPGPGLAGTKGPTIRLLSCQSYKMYPQENGL